MHGECSRAIEDVFGPVVQGCLDNFDFTLLFEETILFVLPASCLLLLAFTWRIPVLTRSAVVVRGSLVVWSKVAIYLLLLISQVVFLAFVIQDDSANTRATIPVTAIGLLAILVMGFLSYLEHRRSLRPSSVLSLYLLATIPMNAARCRTLWNMPSSNQVAVTFLVTTCLMALAVALEIAPKDALVLDEVEKPSQEQMRGIVDRSLLTWILPVFIYGYRHSFTPKTLPSIDPALTRCRFEEEIITNPGHSLLLALMHIHRRDLLKGVIPRACFTALTLAQPYLVETATEWVSIPGAPQRNEKGGALIGAYFLVYVGLAVTYALYRQASIRAATAMRASLTDFIFRRLPYLDSGVGLAGSATTMVSADIERIQFGVREIHDVWGYFIAAAISLYQIERSIGVAMVPALGVAIVGMATTLLVSLGGSNAQKIWFQATEARVSQVVKILADFKSVKMMGYTARLLEDLGAARLLEVRRSQKFRAFLIVVATLAQSSTALVPALGLGTYVLIHRFGDGRILDGGVAFGALTLFTILSSSIAGLLQAVFQLTTAAGCVSRIQSLCNKHYRSDPRRIEVTEKTLHLAVSMTHASAKYKQDSDNIVHDMSFAIEPGTIVRVDGPTTSGKSTLLKMVLGEVLYCEGDVVVGDDQIAYCDQEPWLDSVTIRENITGPTPFDPERYRHAIQLSALAPDLARVPYGDACVCHGNGTTLSGGQRARISLARAIYARPRIMILDDCLSGLDAHTEHTVLNNLLGPRGFLREHAITTFLVSSSQKPLPDDIVELSLGPTGFTPLAISPSVIEPLDIFVRDDKDKEWDEQAPPISSESNDSDVSDKEDILASSEDDFQIMERRSMESVDEDSETYRRGGEFALYVLFVKVGGRWGLLVFVLLSASFVVGVTYPQIFVESWVRRSAAQQHNSIGEFVGLYFGLSAVALCAFAAACTHFTLVIAPRMSITFHDYLAKTLLHAPLSFLNETDRGSITNRFAQDLAVIDQEIPLAFIGTMLTLLQLIAQCVTLIIGSHFSGLAIPGLLVVVYVIQSLYLPTSYQLRLLDLEAKAPMVSLFVRSIEGLTTVRAFGWMEHVHSQSRKYIAASQTPFYLLATVQNMLGLVLDMVTAALAVIVMAIAVGTQSEGIGLSLFSLVGMGTSTKLLISQWTELETSLGVIRRIEQFRTMTPSETSPDRISLPPPNWPSQGEIEFSNTSLAYSESLPPAISELTIKIEPGWKVGICGRTGSGKSTMMTSLLGLVHLKQGRILVDGTDITCLKPDLLRSSITVAPQSAVIIRADVRTNLSQNAREVPSDEQMIALLTKYGLYEKFSSRQGLETLLTDDLLSHGEQQIFSLVRALLHKSRLVLLDEPTSRVDVETQKIMDDAILEGFEGATVLYIAHRLEVLLDFDRVLVMDQGRLVEFDEPGKLMQSPDSQFASMYSKASSLIESYKTIE